MNRGRTALSGDLQKQAVAGRGEGEGREGGREGGKEAEGLT